MEAGRSAGRPRAFGARIAERRLPRPQPWLSCIQGASDTWDKSKDSERSAPIKLMRGGLVKPTVLSDGQVVGTWTSEHPAGDGDRHGRRPVELPMLAELRRAS